MHVMVDLETLGLRTSSVILSIGAVWFDENGDDLPDDSNDRLDILLDIDQQVLIGRTKDQSSIDWWKQQSQEAQDRAFSSYGRSDIYFAAGALMGFCLRHPLDGVWGNGAAFDNAILRDFFTQINKPWIDFHKDRCYRTLRALYPEFDSAKFSGTEHNALHDAMHQARIAQKILKQIPKPEYHHVYTFSGERRQG